jgi:hypothetical protein
MLGNGIAFKLDIPPGINKDDSTFDAEGQWADSDGFRFKAGRPETIGGAVEMASATAVVRPTKMLVFDDAGTTKLCVAGDTLRVGAIDAAGTAITPASNWSINLRHCLAMFGDVLLILQSGARLFESSAGAQAVAVTNAPTQSTVMLVTPSRQVMLLGTQEEVSGTFNSRCIRWSDIEDRTDWSTGASDNAGEYILPGQEDIVAACVLGDYILIWTEGSLWLAQFVGDPGQTFTFQRIAGVGIVALDAHAVLQQTAYWFGQDRRFYSYIIGGVVNPLSCPIERHVRDSLTTTATALGRIFACSNAQHGEVWFAFPFSLASLETRQYAVFCADESVRAQRPVWYLGSFILAGLATGCGAMVDSPLLWDSSQTYKTQMIAHAYNAQGDAKKPFRFDCGATSLGLAFSYIQSADFYLDESRRRTMVKGVIPDFETQGDAVDLTLTFRNRPMSANVTAKGPYSIAVGADKVDFRASGIVVAAKFSTASAARVRFGEPVFELVPGGGR